MQMWLDFGEVEIFCCSFGGVARLTEVHEANDQACGTGGEILANTKNG